MSVGNRRGKHDHTTGEDHGRLDVRGADGKLACTQEPGKGGTVGSEYGDVEAVSGSRK